jgi:cbb3-type cytochrome c oxidase subunit II
MKPELSSRLTALGIFTTFFVGMIFTQILPSFNQNWSYTTSVDQAHFHVPYTAAQEHGRRIYQREGCMYCHSQFVRPLKGEILRYSVGSSVAIPADEREYVYDQPHFLGTRRIGPDLSREGGKYSDDWQLSHLYNPRQMVPGSIMPAFTWLFKPEDPNMAKEQAAPIASRDALDLVAYVQTLGFERQIKDPVTGQWRSWLSPKDQQMRQEQGEAMIERITPGPKNAAIRSGNAPGPTNVVTPGQQ